MFKFFRKIRYQLLKEDKTKRYIKYALGEIILVVIGILIALQVNEWNASRKAQARKSLLLNGLQVEFNVNLNQLDRVLYYNNKVVRSTYQFLHTDINQGAALPIDTLRERLQNTSWLWTFDAQNGALRSGISSGDIHLIKNDTLIDLLFSWPDVVADAKENEDRHINYRLESIDVINRFVRSVDYRGVEHPELGTSKFESDYIGLISDPLFEDYMSERHTHTLDAVNELELVRNQNVKILELVNQELKMN